MNTSKFLLGAALVAAMGLTACSNEEPAPGDGNDVRGNIYVAVRLNDANTSRGSEPASPNSPYQDATAAESDVETADFYFYDAAGLFVTKANVWAGKVEEGNENTNIQFKSNMVVVLKDLQTKNHPKYMVTVLNQPTGFVAPATLADMEAALSVGAQNGILNDNSKFIMATTSFRGATSKPEYYFATELVESNFVTDPTATGYTPAEVYVERLAARVSLSFADSNVTQVTDAGGNVSYRMELKITTAGLDNEEKELTGNIGAEKVYIHFLGWQLNAVAKNTKLLKTIDYADSNAWDSFSFNWNATGDHRSFWGKSYNYGIATTQALYPREDESDDYETNGYTNWDAAWTPGGAAGYPLKYVKLSDIPENFVSTMYCPENTNTSEIVTANGSAITSVLIRARVTSDEAGANAVDLINYRGVVYTKAHYLKYMLNLLNNNGKLNFYTAEGSGESTTYTQIDETFFTIEDAGNGLTKIEPKSDMFVAGSIFKKVGATFEAYTAEELAASTLAADLLALNNKDAGGYEALGYTGGEMFYNIPIEHLNNNTPVGTEVPEAKYGIVRNHCYQITINSVKHLGKGVFDPDKKVVVPDPTPDQDLWNVGATINILSWKIVNQTVDL